MVNKKLVVNDETNIVAKKRGRKSKKELESNKMLLEIEINEEHNSDNINVIIEDTDKEDQSINNIDKLLENDNISEVEDNEIINDQNIFLQDEKSIPKKRGRKPKGGKIIQQIVSNDNNKEIKPNVILHLKCSLKDLYTNSSMEKQMKQHLPHY